MATRRKKRFNPFELRVRPDAALAPIIGKEPITRIEATKKIWSYVRANRLKDKKRKTIIHADKRLRRVFGGKNHVTMFQMTKLFNRHLRDLPPNGKRGMSIPPSLQSDIKRELRKIALSIKRELSRAKWAMRQPLKADLAPRDSGTRGLWITVGYVGAATSVQLWIDHFSGLESPRLWMGFSAASRAPVARLVSLAKVAGFNYKPIKFTASDVTRGKPYNFVEPLKEVQFERLIYEAYANDRQYLGIFKNYQWPFTSRVRKLIVNELKNLVEPFALTLLEAEHSKTDVIKTVGPWARPDKRVERAAVQFMRRKLRREHYKVESHEEVVCGYDLYAVRGSKRRYIEVKGCAGPIPRFFISRTELKAARIHRGWELAIVTNACTDQAKLQYLISGRGMERRFLLEPTQWEGLLRKD